MKAFTRKGHAHRARKQLALETLEARQLMAADTASLVIPTALLNSEAIDLNGDNSSAVRTAAATAAPLSSTTVTTSATIAGNRPLAQLAVRTFDGTLNNLLRPQLGSTFEQLLRAAPAEYGDGISTIGGTDRPSPRMISNTIAAQDEDAGPNERDLSAYIYVFGQFLDHDIDLTESSTTNPEVAAIPVPIADIQFDPDGTGERVIPFTRSIFDSATGTSASNPRQQLNQITAWIDGSQIYGSDKATADSLRTFVGGKLKTSAGGLPPSDEEGFIAGDIRANENIELTSMHALFIREHNRIAAKLARENPRWTDEQIFQRARAIVGAELQVITYKEFLPALLGSNALGRYRGYNPSVDPSVANEFSTAVFRLHTLINDDVEFFGNDGRAERDEVELREAFFNPDLLRETGMDGILKYSASTLAQEADNGIVDGLRNFLFGLPGQGGLDLASLNIQRGRDHGLADYNSVREAYGLDRVTSFADITDNVEVQDALEALYGTVDNIDLWVGALAEDHARGSTLGELSTTIIADQFERLRDGDRFWYQRAFSGTTLAEIERTTLGSIIQRNTTVNNLQSNVFFFKAEISGTAYVDSNSNGRQDSRETALSGVTVELLDDEGEVIDSVVTGRDGRYRFTSFSETGDYQVRIVPPARFTATVTTRDVLISRGGLTVGNVNFALKLARNVTSALATTTSTDAQQLAAVDAVFDTTPSTSTNSLSTFNTPRVRGRARR